MGRLFTVKSVRDVIARDIGADPDMQSRRLDGEIAVELVPQGTLVERIRAGGTGV